MEFQISGFEISEGGAAATVTAEALSPNSFAAGSPRRLGPLFVYGRAGARRRQSGNDLPVRWSDVHPKSESGW